MAITEGAAPPDFTLQDTDGNPVSLAQFANQHLVIYFYPRDDTPGCTKEACGFRDLWSDLGAAGIQVIGVSPDDGAFASALHGQVSAALSACCPTPTRP